MKINKIIELVFVLIGLMSVNTFAQNLARNNSINTFAIATYTGTKWLGEKVDSNICIRVISEFSADVYREELEYNWPDSSDEKTMNSYWDFISYFSPEAKACQKLMDNRDIDNEIYTTPKITLIAKRKYFVNNTYKLELMIDGKLFVEQYIIDVSNTFKYDKEYIVLASFPADIAKNYWQLKLIDKRNPKNQITNGQFTSLEISLKGVYTTAQKDEMKRCLSLNYNDYKPDAIGKQTHFEQAGNVWRKKVLGTQQEGDSIVRQYTWVPDGKLNVSANKMPLCFVYGKSMYANKLQYRFMLNTLKNIDSNTTPWLDMDSSGTIILDKLEHGNYYLDTRYLAGNQYKYSSQEINILPLWYQTNEFLWLVGNIILVIIGLLIFRFYKQKQKQKIAYLQIQQQQSDIKFQSIRNQLNPHFIFNAINSIQGLVLTNEVKKASTYLGNFAQLLRMPLDEQALAHWSLADEIALLKKYVALEQLRFSFRFQVICIEQIACDNISFPAMLLQPIVENSIKHGIANVQYEGCILMHITIEHKDLKIIIKDNGDCFDTLKLHEGNGLKITNQYLQMLNENKTVNKIIMDVVCDNGCKTLFTFPNYID